MTDVLSGKRVLLSLQSTTQSIRMIFVYRFYYEFFCERNSHTFSMTFAFLFKQITKLFTGNVRISRICGNNIRDGGLSVFIGRDRFRPLK